MRRAVRTGALGLLAATWLAACAAPVSHPPSAALAPEATPGGAATPPGLTYRAVLIAGSDDTQAFDNGAERMRDLLIRSGTARPEDITRFTAITGTEGAEAADAATVLGRIASLKPAADQACLVFFTSHGLPKRGLVIMTSRQMVGPNILDRAVTAGCGDRPTLLIMSGCFSGVFAGQPMARPNRVILTAARDDRPSFGCGVKDQYTYFDACLFASLTHGSTWPAVFKATTTCVETREAEKNFDPSHPQAWFGAAASTLPIPAPAAPAAAPAAATPTPGKT